AQNPSRIINGPPISPKLYEQTSLCCYKNKLTNEKIYRPCRFKENTIRASPGYHAIIFYYLEIYSIVAEDQRIKMFILNDTDTSNYILHSNCSQIRNSDYFQCSGLKTLPVLSIFE
ncbi:hypothetical protein MXB_1055, partial [Myxobolus squamalis]